MYKLVIIRHGQTVYNIEKMFCGWTDVDLTEKGVEEAKIAGKNLKNAGFGFDLAFCSVLKRAKDTLNTVVNEIGIKDLPIKYSWRLNEDIMELCKDKSMQILVQSIHQNKYINGEEVLVISHFN